ncbi:hypothetical protein ACTMU2_27215 [Cupriavidus basilensis]
MFASADRVAGAADDLAVLEDFLARRGVGDTHLVAKRDVLQQHQLSGPLAFQRAGVTGLASVQQGGHVVGRV